MTKSKNTKRALLASVLSMMLCLAMLVGSTFAWFTDSVTSGKNKIVAGNLDVELEYSLDGTTWAAVNETTNMFKEGALWEPGYTEVVYLRVRNAGTLALKYKFGINVEDKVIGKTADNKDIDLSNFIKFGVVEADAIFADRTAARNAVKDTAGLISAGYSSGEGHLTKGSTSNMLALVVYMPEEVGNDANYGTGKTQPEIYMGINLVATQDTVESDSFGDQYDVNAEYAVGVSTAEDFVAAVANGENIILKDNIVLPAQLAVNNNLTINGNGKTISAPEGGTRIFSVDNNTEDVTVTLTNLDLSADNAERCISLYNNANAVNLVLDNCSATANKYAINVAGSNANVNLTVKNSEITGWCAFQTWSAGTKATFENCTLSGNNTFPYNADGWNDFATVVINTDAPNAELTFTNCRFEANQTTGNRQFLLSVRAAGAKVTLTDCSFLANGAEIAESELGSYIHLFPAAADLQLIIDGTLIPIG